MNTKKLKEKALKNLKGKYTVIIPALLIYWLISSAFYGTAKLIYNENMNILFNILITGLLYEGLLQIIIKISKGKKAKITELFDRTDLFWKSSAVTIIITLITVICTVLENIAAKSLMTFIINEANINILLSTAMIIFGFLLCTAIAIFYIILMISWSQVYFILYDNEDMPALDIISKSMDLMEEYKIDYITLNLSFIGWIILGILTCGLLYLWVIPYMMVTNANFYYEVKKLEKKQS